MATVRGCCDKMRAAASSFLCGGNVEASWTDYVLLSSHCTLCNTIAAATAWSVASCLKTVGQEVTRGNDPLVRMAMSLVSM